MSQSCTGMSAKSLSLLYALLSAVIISAGCSASPPHPDTFSSKFDNQFGLTFSPDGQAAYWVNWNGNWGADSTSGRKIYYSARQHGRWTAASPMSFSGEFNDDDPFVSPDSNWLYFVSDRPTSNYDFIADTNIWRYNLHESREPELVPINSDASEYSPVVTQSGTVYFASNRAGALGAGDIYSAKPAADGFESPHPLGPAINSEHGEWNLWVSNNESEMIFEASSRATNVSMPGDLYFSWRTATGWSTAVPIVQLNTMNSDLMARLHPDGKTLYYTSAPIGGHAKILIANWQQLKKQLRYSRH